MRLTRGPGDTERPLLITTHASSTRAGTGAGIRADQLAPDSKPSPRGGAGRAALQTAVFGEAGPTSQLFLGCDERQPALGVLPLVQVPRRLGQHHLECRPDMRFEEVAAHCDTVGTADHDVRM